LAVEGRDVLKRFFDISRDLARDMHEIKHV
jgi:hypothetical protein